MGRSALARINLRGNQTLQRKLLAAGIAPLLSSKSLRTNSELIHNLARISQGQGFVFFIFFFLLLNLVALDAERVGRSWGFPWIWGLEQGCGCGWWQAQSLKHRD